MTEPYDVMRMALISARQRFQNMMLDGTDLHNQAEAGFKETDDALENPAGFKTPGDKALGMPSYASVNEPLPDGGCGGRSIYNVPPSEENHP